MNVLLLTSHSIAEYDDLRMLSDLGYDVFSIGAYTDPRHPTDDKRPALALPPHPVLAQRCQEVREQMGEPGPAIDWAKGHIHADIIDWADVIIVHHFPEQWIGAQWNRIRHKRVIWRTCGQSDPRLESSMARFRRDGLQIVRYSPAERRAFSPLGMWAGEDELIRFGKYASDFRAWLGDTEVVGNVTQDMAKRGDACGYDRWLKITAGLRVYPAGPGSEDIGGAGPLPYHGMMAYLRQLRTYLYTGTVPASYTLGLMEAMLAGVPVVPSAWTVPSLDFAWLGLLWEADDIIPDPPAGGAERQFLQACLADRDFAAARGEEHRQRAVELFDVATVGAQWKAFLG